MSKDIEMKQFKTPFSQNLDIIPKDSFPRKDITNQQFIPWIDKHFIMANLLY